MNSKESHWNNQHVKTSYNGGNYYNIPPNYIKKSNGLGTAGFFLSLVAIIAALFCVFPWAFLICIPIAALLCILGFIFSFFGMFKSPRGMAFAGLVVSGISILAVIVAVATLAPVMLAFQEVLFSLF